MDGDVSVAGGSEVESDIKAGSINLAGRVRPGGGARGIRRSGGGGGGLQSSAEMGDAGEPAPRRPDVPPPPPGAGGPLARAVLFVPAALALVVPFFGPLVAWLSPTVAVPRRDLAWPGSSRRTALLAALATPAVIWASLILFPNGAFLLGSAVRTIEPGRLARSERHRDARVRGRVRRQRATPVGRGCGRSPAWPGSVPTRSPRSSWSTSSSVEGSVG